jgi:hypothetical protein
MLVDAAGGKEARKGAPNVRNERLVIKATTVRDPAVHRRPPQSVSPA